MLAEAILPCCVCDLADSIVLASLQEYIPQTATSSMIDQETPPQVMRPKITLVQLFNPCAYIHEHLLQHKLSTRFRKISCPLAF